MNFHIDMLDHEQKQAGITAQNWTTIIDNVLQSGLPTHIGQILNLLFPQTQPIEAVISILEEVFPDLCRLPTTGKVYQGGLQRLGSEFMSLLHGNKHGISDYIRWFEAIYRSVRENNG